MPRTAAESALILIADHNESRRAGLRDGLQRNGHRVIEAADGAAAMESAVRRLPNLVVTQHVLPIVGGLELCRRLGARRDLWHVGVIVVTPFDDAYTRERIIGAGAAGIVLSAGLSKALSVHIDRLLARQPAMLNLRQTLAAIRERAKDQREEAIAIRAQASSLVDRMTPATIGVLLAETSGQLVDATVPACALIGYTRGELLQKQVAELTPVDLLGGGDHWWPQLVSTGDIEGQHILQRKDGRIMAVTLVGSANMLPGLHAVAFCPAGRTFQ